jgi:hypothetical protein
LCSIFGLHLAFRTTLSNSHSLTTRILHLICCGADARRSVPYPD